MIFSLCSTSVVGQCLTFTHILQHSDHRIAPDLRMVLINGIDTFAVSNCVYLTTFTNLSIIIYCNKLLLKFQTLTCDTIITNTHTPSTAMHNCSFTTTTTVFNYLMFAHVVRLAIPNTPIMSVATIHSTVLPYLWSCLTCVACIVTSRPQHICAQGTYSFSEMLMQLWKANLGQDQQSIHSHKHNVSRNCSLSHNYIIQCTPIKCVKKNARI